MQQTTTPRPSTHAFLRCEVEPEVSRFSLGGRVIRATCAAALNIGDAVYVDSNGKVNKSGTAATVGASFIGIVIGGSSFDKEGRVYIEPLVYASPVAASGADGDWVLVQIDGVAQVRATAATSPGDRIIGSATSGSVTPGTTAGAMLGTAVSSSGGGAGVCNIFIDHR